MVNVILKLLVDVVVNEYYSISPIEPIAADIGELTTAAAAVACVPLGSNALRQPEGFASVVNCAVV